MYDRNNHLIDVAESVYSSLPATFEPQAKNAFKISIDKNNDLDHLHIQILATDWGTSYIPPPPNENVSAVGSNSSDRPYMGIAGLSLTPDLSKQIGLNQTKGFLITSITKGSPADKYGLKEGSIIITFNGRDVNVGGDIILKVDNREVSTWYDLLAYPESQKRAGDKVHLTILRDNATRELDLILGQTPNQPVFAGGNNVGNLYFSIHIPDNWTYIESSNTPEAKNTGFGPGNSIELTPNEFSEILLNRDIVKLSEKIQDGGALAHFTQDTDYPKNAPLESYVKYQIDNYGILNITSQQYTTVGKEKSVRIYANEAAYYGNSKIALYLLMHDNEPYYIGYLAGAKNYEKYLPEFEQMVKSFTFVGSALSENGENLTNTRTNFSSANATEYTSGSKSQQDLYNECVNVAGKSLCDSLFKR
jgi:hypothetical protein